MEATDTEAPDLRIAAPEESGIYPVPFDIHDNLAEVAVIDESGDIVGLGRYLRDMEARLMAAIEARP